MKNRISVEIDTENSPKVKFNKPKETERPSNDEERKKMVDTDIITLTAGLVELIDFASTNGLGIKEEYKEFVFKSLNDLG